MEKLLEEVCFDAPGEKASKVKITADYVEKHIGELAKNTDLSKFIL